MIPLDQVDLTQPEIAKQKKALADKFAAQEAEEKK